MFHALKPPRTARRLAFATAATAATLLLAAVPAAAHVEVESEKAQALAVNAEVAFEAESESTTAGITQIRVVLPEGIDPADVTYQDGPKGWKFTAGADGCTIGGPALKTGENARYSVLVRRLPDVRELAFKTLQSHSDGRVDRWIALDEGAENPAPVLELGAAVPGARATGSPGASASAPASPAGQGAEPSSSPAAEAKKDDDGGVPRGAWAGIGAAALAVVAVVFAVRRRSAARR
ncbi:DUF1775 domain-containing protein [Streptomyces sp. NPDC096198]|uniref:DUF1775 domain-containing protein n=1 Tax=Streptomyces sp. NPDC096198 TaxID=3366080 RepID=UPI0037F2D098